MSVKRVEVVERSLIDTLPLPLLSRESWMFVKENPNRKKNIHSFVLSSGILLRYRKLTWVGFETTSYCLLCGDSRNWAIWSMMFWYSHELSATRLSDYVANMLSPERLQLTSSNQNCSSLSIFPLLPTSFSASLRFLLLPSSATTPIRSTIEI